MTSGMTTTLAVHPRLRTTTGTDDLTLVEVSIKYSPTGARMSTNACPKTTRLARWAAPPTWSASLPAGSLPADVGEPGLGVLTGVERGRRLVQSSVGPCVVRLVPAAGQPPDASETPLSTWHTPLQSSGSRLRFVQDTCRMIGKTCHLVTISVRDTVSHNRRSERQNGWSTQCRMIPWILVHTQYRPQQRTGP